MLVRFTFGDPIRGSFLPSDPSTSEFDLEELIGSLRGVRRLWDLLTYLASDDDDGSGEYVQSLIKDPPQPLLKFSWLGSYPGFTGRVDLGITRISYNSPLEIDAINNSPHTHRGKLRQALDLVKGLLTIDAMQNKARWEAEITRQRAIEATLKNAERMLDLSKKIKNAELRDEFVRALSKSIISVTMENGPRLESIELISDTNKQRSAA